MKNEMGSKLLQLKRTQQKIKNKQKLSRNITQTVYEIILKYGDFSCS
jgi:hypothetical protein